MNLYIISNCSLIREGIMSTLSREKDINIVSGMETLEGIEFNKKQEYIIVVDLHRNNLYEINNIKKLKQNYVDLRFLIIDFYRDIDIFLKCIDIGVDAYLLYKQEYEEIVNYIRDIGQGKYNYDSYMTSIAIKSSKQNSVDRLTERESEILVALGRGMTNKDISNTLYITENTVKKHMNSIFAKLNLRDRVEAVIYAYENGLVKLKSSNDLNRYMA